MAEKEYIEREAMIQRLKNTPLFSNFNTGGIFLRDGVIDLVEKHSAADVVEVVRCRECKFYEIHKPNITLNCERTSKIMPMMPNDFCSYGERKEK